MCAHSTLCLALVALGMMPQELILGWAATASCASAVVSNQPQSQTVLENCPVTFSVGVTGTGPFSYQWHRDNQPIPGATNNSYTMPHAVLRDNGAQFQATIANACSQVVSSNALIYISLDVVPPRLLRARGDASLERVIVTFGVGGCGGFPGLDPSSAQDPYNYSFIGSLTVSNAQLEPSGTSVILTTSRQSPNTLYTLRVEGVSDLSGNLITPGSEATIQSWVLMPGIDPEVVPPAVSLFRVGSDIWITWPYGSFLQSADDIAGPWRTLLNPDFPYPVTTEGAARFYRAFFDP